MVPGSPVVPILSMANEEERMILLSPEEIQNLDYRYTGTFKSSREVDEWVKHVVAKAQLKNVVEYLEKHNVEDDEDKELYLGLDQEHWQALLEEVKE